MIPQSTCPVYKQVMTLLHMAKFFVPTPYTYKKLSKLILLCNLTYKINYIFKNLYILQKSIYKFNRKKNHNNKDFTAYSWSSTR